MDGIQVATWILLIAITVLMLCSAYFASSETAMMKLNPYRLRHLVREKHLGARKVNRLLRRQDRLLGVILIGNNLVNNCLVLIANIVFVRWFGDAGYVVTVVGFTIFLLVFAEIAPKTIAAERPETIAFPSSFVLDPLLKILSPVVRMANFLANQIANPFIRRTKEKTMDLSTDELRTVVNAGPATSDHRQSMLLGILDLEKATVRDIMVPRSEVIGIDLDDPIEDIANTILTSQHTRLPVYRESINDVVGILHLRRASRLLSPESFDHESILQEAEEPYFVPEASTLPTQLHHFKENKSRLAIVVDEYGDVVGIATLEDILEEIVGDFTTNIAEQSETMSRETDGSYVLSGGTMMRDINSNLNWDMPTGRPRTLNGLLLEQLESIPDANVGVRVGRYRLETLQIVGGVVKTVRVSQVPDMDVDEVENPN